MAHPLSEADKSILTLELADQLALAKTTRTTGIRFSKRNWHEAVMSKLSSGAKAWIDKYIDDSDLSSAFQIMAVAWLLEAGFTIPSRVGQKLTSLPSIPDVLTLSRTLIDQLDKIPERYLLVAPGPTAFPESAIASLSDDPIAISSQLRLMKGSAIAARFSPKGDFTSFVKFLSPSGLSQTDFVIDSKRLYFVYQNSGFLASRFENRLVRDCEDEIRSFYGAMLALEIFDNFAWIEEEGNRLAVFVKRESFELVATRTLESDINTATYFDLSDALNEENIDIVKLVRVVHSAFTAKHARQLKTAAVWVLRAHQSRRDIDRVLEATIAIEVMLGDKELSSRVGISRLLANRCAYSLAKTVEERQSIASFFEKLYSARSSIVHSGEHRTSKEEREVVWGGISLANRVLAHEIRLVHQGVPAEANLSAVSNAGA